MKKTFIEWLQILQLKSLYYNFEYRYDVETQTLHLKWVGK